MCGQDSGILAQPPLPLLGPLPSAPPTTSLPLEGEPRRREGNNDGPSVFNFRSLDLEERSFDGAAS
jgi:hypothetical protein